MKVILKGGSHEKNEEIKKFFMAKIFSVLNFGIAFEPSDAVITVYEKKKGGTVEEYVDPTAEVIVELTENAKNLALNLGVEIDELKKVTGNFHDEALAIRLLETLRLPFSIEYYVCRYTPKAESLVGYESIHTAPERQKLSVIWGSYEEPEYGIAVRLENRWYDQSDTGSVSDGRLREAPIAWHPGQSAGLR